MKNEKAIITTFLKNIKIYYPLSFTKKIQQNMYSRGFPDLIIITEGASLYLEAKQKGKTPTVLQENCLNEISNAGGYAGWFDFDKDTNSFRIFFNKKILIKLDSSVLWKDEKLNLYYFPINKFKFKDNFNFLLEFLKK